MRGNEPFLPNDLQALDGLLSRGHVTSMEVIYDVDQRGRWVDPGHVIGMRHDCDNVIHPAVPMAKWEHERGYRSTYYILHTSPYWQDKTLLRTSLERIAECGHEIGIHNDAITVQRETGRPAADVLHEAIDEIRGYGHTIRSTVAHGHRRCSIERYVNDEMFKECYRADYGAISRLGIQTHSLAEFGLDFDANWLPRGDYLSDSGGQWSQPFGEVAAAFPSRGQLHMLVHPDWWGQALEPKQVAA